MVMVTVGYLGSLATSCDGNQGIPWEEESQLGRRSDTSPQAATWSQVGCKVKISSELLQVPPITNWSAGANGEVVVEAPLRLASDHLHTSIVVKTSLFPGKLAS